MKTLSQHLKDEGHTKVRQLLINCNYWIVFLVCQKKIHFREKYEKNREIGIVLIFIYEGHLKIMWTAIRMCT